jgi:cytoskeletal protein CcmA (bactofilin family)
MSAASPIRTEAPAVKAILGPNVVVKGQILSKEDLTIQGEVEGTIEISDHRLTIAANGNVRANVTARDIEVLGSMHGKIEAGNKVYIRKGAQFVGDIHAAGIVIEDGGYIKGGIDLSREPGNSKSADGEILPNRGSIQELSNAVLAS